MPIKLSLRRVTTAIALLLAMPLCAAPKPHHAPKTRDVIEAIDEQWRTAQTSGDAAAMDKLLSDDYLGITGFGQVVTKAQALDRMRARTTMITRLDVSDVKIKVVGAVAIVTSLAELEGTIDGKAIHGKYRSTRIYQRLPSGAWKLTSFEATPTREPGFAGKAKGTTEAAPS